MFMFKKPKIMFCAPSYLMLAVVIMTGCVAEPNMGNREPLELENLSPESLYSTSTGNIHDYMPDIIAYLSVSCYELLPCLENFNHETWTELDKAYGLDWWNPLWKALYRTSVVSGQSEADYEEQSLRNYFVGKAILASDGAYTEGLVDIMKLQWDYDKALYSLSLTEHFSSKEGDTLRRILVGSFICYNEDLFSLYIPDISGTEKPLYLDTYPTDFPFYLDLEEKDRISYNAESFGLINNVESDGLQITYLTPNKEIYTIITIRAVKKGCSTGGSTIGDTEESLLEQWKDKPLKKLGYISYDDEAWFGDQYDFAYTYTQAEGTKSVVFLIEDGIIRGIELINGLDGAVY